MLQFSCPTNIYRKVIFNFAFYKLITFCNIQATATYILEVLAAQ